MKSKIVNVSNDISSNDGTYLPRSPVAFSLIGRFRKLLPPGLGEQEAEKSTDQCKAAEDCGGDGPVVRGQDAEQWRH